MAAGVSEVTTDKLNVPNNTGIVKLILDPLIQSMFSSHHSKEVAEVCTLQMTLTVDSICKLQPSSKVILKAHICNIENRIKEYVLALEQSKELLFNKESSWKTSSVVVVKFNVDAVVLKDFTILAVVA